MTDAWAFTINGNLTYANRGTDDGDASSFGSTMQSGPPIRSYRCQTNISSLPQNYDRTNLLGEEEKVDKSLFIFSEHGFIRTMFKKVVENKIFEYFMLLTIAANCVVLMIATPLSSNDNSELNIKLEQGDLVFVAIFTLEALLKIIVYGFIGSSEAYLRSGWNILDFVVVIVGLFQVSTVGSSGTSKRNSESIRALRAVRVLRPLKLVSGVPSLQILLKSLFRAMVPLLQILLLVLFVIIIYSIVGLELLRGRYHYTCFKVDDAHPNGTLEISFYNPKPHPCDYFGSWGRKCKEGEICRRALPSEWLGPNYGITTFDNMFSAMLTVFQCITLEGWSEIMYLTIDSRDKKTPIFTWSAFVLLIVVGSFFMLNLVLGVLSGEFAKERERVENRKSFLKLRRQKQMDRQVEHYIHWIEKADEISADEDENNTGDERIFKDFQESTFPIEVKRHTEIEFGHRKSRGLKVKKQRSWFQRTERRFRIRLRHLIKSKVFFWVVLLLVLLNTLSMSCSHYKQSQQFTQILDITEIVFTTLFFIEMIIRAYSLGLSSYFRSAFNRFNFVIVWLSIADLIYRHVQETNSVGISVMRTVRLLRIFKITRFWSSMQNVISSLMNSIRSILSLILLLLLFIFIFALLGMQLFGGQFNSVHKGASKTNFDNFPKAMLAVFQIMTGEDWNSIMYQGITAFNGPKSVTGMLVSLYFVSLVIIGNYTLLNVFLAIAVDNLANAQVFAKDAQREALRMEEENKARLAVYTQPEPKVSKWGKVRSVPKMLAFAKKIKEEEDANPFKGLHYKRRPPMILRAVSESDLPAPNYNMTNTHPKFSSLDISTPTSYVKRNKAFLPHQKSFDDGLLGLPTTPQLSLQPPLNKPLSKLQPQLRSENSTDLQCSTQLPSMMRLSSLSVPDANFRGSWKVLKRRNLQSKKVLNTRSLLIFSPSNRLRTACHTLVTWKHFENTMLFFILISSLLLAVEDPLCNSCQKNKILMYVDVGFVGIFTFEIIVKLIDQGAIAHKGSYLRDRWNVLDTLVVACNIAATIMSVNGDQNVTDAIGGATVKAMRILRVFRPLRVVNKINGLKVVFQCVVFSLKRVLNIIIITMLCLFMFAVVGNHLFQGKFHYCTDQSKLTEQECQGDYFYYHTPINNPHNYTIMARQWKNYNFNFDSVPIAMLTLFSCGTGEGWPIVMEKSIDATDVDQGPIPNNNMFLSLYYVCFVVVFSFFFLNIFVALIIVTFQEQGEKENIGSELTRNQRACLQFVLNSKPRQRFMPHDKNQFSYKVWRVVDSKPFEILIMGLIALNAIILMLSFDSQSVEYENMLEKVNLVFTFLFTAEAILKLIAYKLNYFRDSWNVCDFCIVFVTLVGAFINLFNSDPKDLPIDPSFFRLFRAFRLLKLLRQGYNIRILLWTFLQSLRSLPYVMLLIAMLFFIYAVIGMQLFSRIAFDSRRHINEYNHFRGFLNSLGVLFRCGTGEAWHLVMLDCFDRARCYNNPSKQCGSTLAAIIYFCSFYFLYAFLLLNLFVAVIMDNFDYLTRDESILGPHHMDEFVRVWSEYDPSAAGRIPHEDIYQLMCDMQPPVGFGKKCPRFLAYKRLMKLNMPISGDNTVQFTPTIFALVRTSLRMTHHEKGCFKDSSFRKIIKRIWPNTTQKTLDIMMPEQTVLSDQQITIGKIYAAKLIYESFKEIKRRKNCTLPQFEMFEATHRRGNSFFQKMIGALRTTSQPLVAEKNVSRSREESFSRRRLSSTSPLRIEFGERHSNPARIRSTSAAGFIPRACESYPSSLGRKLSLATQQSVPVFVKRTSKNTLYEETTFQCPKKIAPKRFSPKRKRSEPKRVSQAITSSLTNAFVDSNLSLAKPDSLSYNCENDGPNKSDFLQLKSDFEPRKNENEMLNKNERTPSDNKPTKIANKSRSLSLNDGRCDSLAIRCTPQSESGSQALTDSLITALRDPAKPILCFLNPQVGRDHSRTQSDIAECSNESSPDSRQPISPCVTLSLPMIKLEIPVERDRNFTHRPLCKTDSNIPDIIKSTRKSTPLTTQAPLETSIRVSGQPSGAITSCNQPNGRQAALKELNERVNLALSEGIHWIYKIGENEDTWC